MKTLVLQLDRTEDVGSIRDKVTWGKASRVLLVWPVNFSMLDRKIDLVTVKRICTAQGSRLGIVSDIPEIIAEAEELQIPVFDSVNRAMRKAWDRRKGRNARGRSALREAGSMDIEKLRIGKYSISEFWNINENMRLPVFLLAVMAVFAILIFLFPSAKVIVFPQGRSSEMQIEFRVLEGQGSDSIPGVLAATKKTLKMDGETTVPTSGSIQAPDLKAIGAVTISNLTPSDVIIPAGTLIQKPSNPPVRYQILESVTLPANEITIGIGIEAIEPGEKGNTDSNTITRLDGPLGLLVEVSNPGSVSGGSGKTYQAVLKEDILLAAEKNQSTLKTQAEAEFTKSLSDQEIILPSSIQVVKVVEQTEHPGVGQVGVLLKLKQTVEYSVLVINQPDMEKQAETILNANQPTKGWVSSRDGPVEIKILSQEFAAKTGSVILQVTISKIFAPLLDTSTIRSQIAGKSKVVALEILGSSAININPPEIQTTPGWLPFLPLLSSRVEIEVR
ncbi:MAG: baseplate J/gp47 family protein [Leptolinea sp.]